MKKILLTTALVMGATSAMATPSTYAEYANMVTPQPSNAADFSLGNGDSPAGIDQACHYFAIEQGWNGGNSLVSWCWNTWKPTRAAVIDAGGFEAYADILAAQAVIDDAQAAIDAVTGSQGNQFGDYLWQQGQASNARVEAAKNATTVAEAEAILDAARDAQVIVSDAIKAQLDAIDGLAEALEVPGVVVLPELMGPFESGYADRVTAQLGKDFTVIRNAWQETVVNAEASSIAAMAFHQHVDVITTTNSFDAAVSNYHDAVRIYNSMPNRGSNDVTAMAAALGFTAGPGVQEAAVREIDYRITYEIFNDTLGTQIPAVEALVAASHKFAAEYGFPVADNLNSETAHFYQDAFNLVDDIIADRIISAVGEMNERAQDAVDIQPSSYADFLWESVSLLNEQAADIAEYEQIVADWLAAQLDVSDDSIIDAYSVFSLSADELTNRRSQTLGYAQDIIDTIATSVTVFPNVHDRFTPSLIAALSDLGLDPSALPNA